MSEIVELSCRRLWCRKSFKIGDGEWYIRTFENNLESTEWRQDHERQTREMEDLFEQVGDATGNEKYARRSRAFRTQMDAMLNQKGGTKENPDELIGFDQVLVYWGGSTDPHVRNLPRLAAARSAGEIRYWKCPSCGKVNRYSWA